MEYDDVMNKQRSVIYEKRRHALIGERIGMDIANIIWDRVLNILDMDYEGAKENFLKILAMEMPFTQEEFEAKDKNELAELAFQAAMASFKRKTDRIQQMAWPVVKEVYENQGAIYQRIMVPITDGKGYTTYPASWRKPTRQRARASSSSSRSHLAAHHRRELERKPAHA